MSGIEQYSVVVRLDDDDNNEAWEHLAPGGSELNPFGGQDFVRLGFQDTKPLYREA